MQLKNKLHIQLGCKILPQRSLQILNCRNGWFLLKDMKHVNQSAKQRSLKNEKAEKERSKRLMRKAEEKLLLEELYE